LVKQIELSHGKFALVDDDDFERINQNKWKFNNRGYAVRLTHQNKKWKTHSMHRVILNAEDGQIVDHKNGDRLDNRKENLRIASPSQNCWNSKLCINNTSGYKGVSLEKKTGKWNARIHINNKKIHLGAFENKHDAARMYNFWAIDLFGEFAQLNVITEEVI
jgi:hypothetical protein